MKTFDVKRPQGQTVLTDTSVYHQMQVWKSLSELKDPLHQGCKVANNSFPVIRTDIEARPPVLLKVFQ